MPSESTLADYTHWTTPHSGVQSESTEQLKRILLLSKPHNVALSMNEMQIKSSFVFSKHSSKLTGFVDAGSVNAGIEDVLGDDNTKTEKKLADHAFVFQVRAVFKPSIAIPVAYYFSASFSGTDFVHACMPVRVYTCPLCCVTMCACSYVHV